MRVGSELRCRGLSRPYGPHRFVGHHQFARLLRRNSMERPQTLATKHILGESRFALLEYLSHANNGSEPSFESDFEFHVHDVIGLAEILSSFRVPEDHVRTTDGQNH